MPESQNNQSLTDLLIIGGGVNGCGIARDAAGRGLSVRLVEMNDLASATSSASSASAMSTMVCKSGLSVASSRRRAGGAVDVIISSMARSTLVR